MTTTTLHTNFGDIVIEMFEHQAPKTVANFVGLANGTREYTDFATGTKKTGKFYDGLIFHRVIDEFMIQGGCPKRNGTGDPGYKFADEFHGELVFDRPYLLAMANSGPNTNGSQFFITVKETPHLDRKHTIFGEVKDAASQAVVDAISLTDVGAGHKPVKDVVINSVTVA
jgi:peptidyl-prolyl cis-trans isomerase A (cyclophilin A)